jgi:hypothetical protein
MTHVTQVLQNIEQGDTQAAEQLLPLVCDGGARVGAEAPGPFDAELAQDAAAQLEARCRQADVADGEGGHEGGEGFGLASLQGSA